MSLEQQLSELTQAVIRLAKAVEYHQAVIDEVENCKPEPKVKPKQEVKEKINTLTDAEVVAMPEAKNSPAKEKKPNSLASNEPLPNLELPFEGLAPEPKVLQDFCMKLVRKDTSYANKIREVLALFEAKVISDVQASDLPELAKRLEALK